MIGPIRGGWSSEYSLCCARLEKTAWEMEGGLLYVELGGELRRRVHLDWEDAALPTTRRIRLLHDVCLEDAPCIHILGFH